MVVSKGIHDLSRFSHERSLGTVSKQARLRHVGGPCSAGISPSFNITFYAGRYDALLLGIVPVGNPMDCIARASMDVVVLEEPEHLSWFHCGPQWTSSFKHVVSQVSNAGVYKQPFVNKCVVSLEQELAPCSVFLRICSLI